MAHLSIRLLGPPQIALDENSIADFGSDKVRALLFYLAAEPDQPHRRETLAGLLWPDYPERSARASLRSALADLRKAIGDRQTESPFLCISRQAIQFNADSDAWCDAVAFASALESVPAFQSMSPQLAQKLAQAVALYRGDFLTGFSIGDSAIFDEWATLKREQLRRQASASLQRLIAYHEANKSYETALTYAWRRLDLEPWQEEEHRQVMRLLALNGQRGAALAQYETCRRTLAEELNLEPAPETIALYEQIRDGSLPVSPLPEPLSPSTPESPAPSSTAAPKPDRPATVKRLALIGSGLLLLAIVTSAALAFASNSKQNAATSPTLPAPAAVQIEGGKHVDLCEGVTPPQICVIDQRTQVRSITAGLDFGEIGPGLSWSPDGEQIAFDAGSDAAQSRVLDHKIYTIYTDGSGLHQVTSGSTDIGPAWSPDGQWIAFIRDGALWLVRPDGSEPRHLWGEPGEKTVTGIAWSIDSQHIAFLNVPFPMAVSAGSELWTINRDGSEPKIIHVLEQRILGGGVAWGPDSKQIVCLCAFDDGEKPLLFDLDDNNEPQVMATVPVSWFHGFWPQWESTDGK